ncbi:alpha/beta fold hydrolase [Azospirillum doebereinerae]|uniref:alpha/beta fold hydrolase n=1 Tax=Azospirillum doebereinerae TaxID=92933 RepID=UPI001EE62BC0|nr:alpha/beta hydrolase [Azospirillum doebereinerae]MCG5243224.1 alpha/beta fold hydrolase [Azospirillum doebereinerae]
MAFPHYATTAAGQLRVWREGSGPDLVVLPGLTVAASVRARMLAETAPGWRVTVVELPGIGGSAGLWADSLEGLAERIAEALAALGIGPAVLLAHDLTGPLAVALARRVAIPPAAVLLSGADAARAWSGQGIRPPSLAPRQDGAHLLALWTHIRDRHLLDPEIPHLPAFDGPAIPSDADLNEAVVAASVAPERYEALWSLCAGGSWNGVSVNGVSVEEIADGALAARLVSLRGALPKAGALPPTRPFADPAALWCDHVDIPAGRVHLRRAGGEGRPLLVFQTGGGSAAPFAPVVRKLAERHRVIAPDYLGNGWSDKPERPASIEALATDALAVADALGLEEFDLWGSHTGALVALEILLRQPNRVGRAVLEAPVFVSGGFLDDVLRHYFPPLVPDRWGRHLVQAWNWRRDMFLYWPWYRVERPAARRLGLPEAEDLHAFTVGLLQSGAHYDRAYRAAFEYDTAARIGQATRPMMICSGADDMLADSLDHARTLAPPGTLVTLTPATVWWPRQRADAVAETLRMYEDFLEG